MNMARKTRKTAMHKVPQKTKAQKPEEQMDFMHPKQSALSQKRTEFLRDEGSDFNLLILSDINGCHLLNGHILPRWNFLSHIGTLKVWFQNSR